MVHVFLALYASLKIDNSVNVYCFVHFQKVLGGMRGMTGLVWETSLLDPEEVHPIYQKSATPYDT